MKYYHCQQGFLDKDKLNSTKCKHLEETIFPLRFGTVFQIVLHQIVVALP